MADESSWTPYGLEAIRVSHAARRRRIAALVLLLLGLLALFIFRPTSTSGFDVSTNGESGGGNQFSIDVPNDQPKHNGPVTISLTPGRVTLADSQQGQDNAAKITRSDVPTYGAAPGINFTYYTLVYGPWVLLGAAGWMLTRRRGKHDEVNFGVHKGAMPLEMISAHARDQIHTRRHAKESIFGKRREDYLPDQVSSLPTEADA